MSSHSWLKKDSSCSTVLRLLHLMISQMFSDHLISGLFDDSLASVMSRSFRLSIVLLNDARASLKRTTGACVALESLHTFLFYFLSRHES